MGGSARSSWLVGWAVAAVSGVVAAGSLADPAPDRARWGEPGYLKTACPVEKLGWKGSWEDATAVVSPAGEWLAGAAAESDVLNTWHGGAADAVTVPASERVEVRDVTDTGAVLGVSFDGGVSPKAAWLYKDGDFRELSDDDGSGAVDVRDIVGDGTIHGESLGGEPLSGDPDEPPHGDNLVWEPGATEAKQREPLDLEQVTEDETGIIDWEASHLHVWDVAEDGTMVGDLMFTDPGGGNEPEHAAWIVTPEGEHEEVPVERSAGIDSMGIASDWVAVDGTSYAEGTERWRYGGTEDPDRVENVYSTVIDATGTLYDDTAVPTSGTADELPGLDGLPLAHGGDSRGKAAAVSPGGQSIEGESGGEPVVWRCGDRG